MNRLNIKLGILFLAILLLVGGENVVTVAQEATPTAPPQEIIFPELTGPYKVGLTSFEWVDQSRDETYASIPGLKRDLMVYIWFPASPEKRAKVAPYMLGDLMWDIFSKHPGLDSMIHSHAYSTKVLNADKPSYPVLIFSAGFTVMSLNYASILEEIASYGYIVIGTSHPYTDDVISYPDGRVLIGGIVRQSVTVDAALLNVWTQDMRFVLDQAENLNATDNQFKGHLDLTRVGVIGHSMGGVAAAEVAAIDPRVKAGVNLDGNLSSDGVTADVTTSPFLFFGINADTSSAQNGQDKYLVVIDGAEHLNYGDFALLRTFVPEWHAGGSIDPARGVQIVNGYVLAFFNHYLNGSDLNWPIYDEAQLTTLQ